MRRLVLLCSGLLLTVAALGWAATVTTKPWCVIGWDANPEPDLASYRVYVSRVSGSYGAATLIVTAPWRQASCAELGITTGRYFVRVTAVDTSDNEGPPIAEIDVDVQVPVRVQP